MMRTGFSRRILCGLLIAAVPGCTAGPNFVPPPPPPPATGYAGAGAGVMLGDGAQERWWESFGSAELDALVDRALANNQSLATADATLARALAHSAAVAGHALPQVDANARVEHEEINLAAVGFNPASFPGLTNPVIQLYTLGGGVSYDLDLAGKNRRIGEQARADAEAEAWQARAAHFTIAGRVVMNYLAIAALRARIATQTALIDESRRNVELTERRKQAGEGTLVDVVSARAELAEDESQLPAMYQALAEARDMLAVLLGVSPAELGPTDYAMATLSPPATVPVAIPSALVHRRPDILAAEARLHAAVAAIGVAQANFYPDVTLGATGAQSTPALASLFGSGFRGIDLFGAVSAPLFHGGTLKAEKQGAEANARAAAARYRQTVLEAFGQVSDQMSALDTLGAARAATRASADLAHQSLDLSRASFKVGNIGILDVLEASRRDARARLALLDIDAQRLQAVARLYAATAGGWHGPGKSDSDTRN